MWIRYLNEDVINMDKCIAIRKDEAEVLGLYNILFIMEFNVKLFWLIGHGDNNRKLRDIIFEEIKTILKVGDIR